MKFLEWKHYRPVAAASGADDDGDRGRVGVVRGCSGRAARTHTHILEFLSYESDFHARSTMSNTILVQYQYIIDRRQTTP